MQQSHHGEFWVIFIHKCVQKLSLELHWHYLNNDNHVFKKLNDDDTYWYAIMINCNILRHLE